MNFMTYLPETATSSNLSGNASNGTNTDWLAGCDLVPLSLALPASRSAFDECFVLEDLGIVRSQWQNDTSFVPTSVTYALTFALGVLGNVLVVFALVGDRKGRNVTTSFLVSLAAADLVFLLICVPYEMVAKLTSYWKGGRVLCKIAGFAEMLSACASVLNLTAVTVERYVVIVHPMKSRSWCTMGNTKKIIVGVWIIALLLAAPLLYVMDIETLLYHNPHDFHIISTCADINLVSNGDRLVLAWYQLGAMFLLPTLVMVYCYAIVIHVLWVSTKELARMTHTPRAVVEGRSRLPSGSSLGRGSSGGGHAKGHVAFRDTPAVRDHSAEVREARKQVIKMLLTIIGIFLICWGPKLIVNILKKHQLATLHSGSAFYLTSCSNPLIYSFMSNNFRRSMRLSCRSVCKFDPYDCCYRDPRHEYEIETKSVNGSYTMTSRNKRMATASTYTAMTSDA